MTRFTRKPRVWDTPPIPRPKEYELLEAEQILAGAVSKSVLTSGIYFLLSEGQIVYVGQSINSAVRVYEHVRKKVIKFDSYFTLPCKRSDLTPLESRYIQKFRPKFNKTYRWDRSHLPLDSLLGEARRAAVNDIQRGENIECEMKE